jgi:hypothetical protein
MGRVEKTILKMRILNIIRVNMNLIVGMVQAFYFLKIRIIIKEILFKA